MQLDNSYARLPKRFYARLKPAGSPKPVLLAWNPQLAEALGLNPDEDSQQLAQWFSGNQILPGSDPIALAYAGHQFGFFVPQLGDGRALLLGDPRSATDGLSYDLQLKGSGRTPFSRGGDGKSTIGPVMREYLLSEAMHHLGIPTTRALAAVLTGASVQRETRLPGAVLTRVAASHIRIGTFEYFSVRRDFDALRSLVAYALSRHDPNSSKADKSPALALFSQVVERQAELIAAWMSVGFVHGVMNTDNMAISGETIDYGPCAFLDEFSYDKVFSSIDQDGRYAYSNQPEMALWNLARLAQCLQRIDKDQVGFESVLMQFTKHYKRHYTAKMARKLGLLEVVKGDEQLISEWLDYLQAEQLDFTLSFRRLADRLLQDEAGTTVFGNFETRWRSRVMQQGVAPEVLRESMNRVNPAVIARNHQLERAIDAAIQGDLSIFNQLQQILMDPFAEQAIASIYAKAPREGERVLQTFCGT